MPDLEPDTKSQDDLEPGYLVVCWNDPVNLMDYVAHVFHVGQTFTKSPIDNMTNR